MSLDVGTALSEGFRRTFTRNGLLLAVAFVLIGVVSAVASQTLLAEFFESILEVMRANRGTGEGEVPRETIRAVEVFARSWTPFSLSISTAVAWLLVALTAVVAEAAKLVSARVFFSERTNDISAETLRRNIVMATANGIIGGIVVTIFIAIGGILGLVLLIIGSVIVALFLAMSFLFLRQEIAIEDKNFVDAMTDSWNLAKGDRIELFALVLVVVIAIVVVSYILTFVFALISPIAGAIVGLLIGGVTAVFGTASVTRAYAQLHAERAGDEQEDSGDEWKY